MDDFEDLLRTEARGMAVAAYNHTQGWIDHPTYNTKGSILQNFDDAEAVLSAVERTRDRAELAATGRITGRAGMVAGVDLRALRALRATVKGRRGNERMVLPPLGTVVFGGHRDDGPGGNPGDK